VIVGWLSLQVACSWQADPAIRLADCVEEAVKEQTPDSAAILASCDLEMAGNYLLVLHPEGPLREEEVVSAGFPRDLLPELRVLKLGTNPGIYVIATDPGVTGTGADRSPRSSWTTSQMHFVQIDRLMVLAKTSQPVRVDLGGSSERRVIEAIH
jgi:hypothetical protein